MRDLLDQIRKANSSGLYYVSLFSALTLPDICGALESANGIATKASYIDWFDQNVTPKYQTLTGEDAYYFRCSILHQGSTRHPRNSFSRILFVEPSATTNIFHNNVINGALNIDIMIFVNDFIEAAEFWLVKAEKTPNFQRNYPSAIQRYPNGLQPYIIGVPVIS